MQFDQRLFFFFFFFFFWGGGVARAKFVLTVNNEGADQP